MLHLVIFITAKDEIQKILIYANAQIFYCTNLNIIILSLLGVIVLKGLT